MQNVWTQRMCNTFVVHSIYRNQLTQLTWWSNTFFECYYTDAISNSNSTKNIRTCSLVNFTWSFFMSNLILVDYCYKNAYENYFKRCQYWYNCCWSSDMNFQCIQDVKAKCVNELLLLRIIGAYTSTVNIDPNIMRFCSLYLLLFALNHRKAKCLDKRRL